MAAQKLFDKAVRTAVFRPLYSSLAPSRRSPNVVRKLRTAKHARNKVPRFESVAPTAFQTQRRLSLGDRRWFRNCRPGARIE